MLLKDVALVLKAEEHPRVYRSDFAFRARSTCHFISRVLPPLKFNAAGFWRIVVAGCHMPDKTCRVRGGDVLHAEVCFDQQKYESLSGDDRCELFLDMLTEGLSKAHESFDFPYKSVLESMDLFRAGEYRNEWVHKKKLFRGLGGLRGSLLCTMDTERFVLTLRLERKGEVLHEASLLETKPDELCFAHQFKDLVIRDGKLIVTSSVSEPLVEFDLSSLLLS